MKTSGISFNTRKALANKMGEPAGQEIADLISHLVARIEKLERSKVDVTPVISSPGAVTLRSGSQDILAY